MHVSIRRTWFTPRWFLPAPRGWTLMAYERNGKMVCRYFYRRSQP